MRSAVVRLHPHTTTAPADIPRRSGALRSTKITSRRRSDTVFDDVIAILQHQTVQMYVDAEETVVFSEILQLYPVEHKADRQRERLNSPASRDFIRFCKLPLRPLVRIVNLKLRLPDHSLHSKPLRKGENGKDLPCVLCCSFRCLNSTGYQLYK